MRSRRLHRPAMAIVLFAASQVGHLLTTELRHGPGAAALYGPGVHAHAPTRAAGAPLSRLIARGDRAHPSRQGARFPT